MREPDFVSWVENGKQFTQVSAPWKRELLADYANKYGCKTFVETGTCEGDTVAELASMFDMVYSIEFNQEFYERAARRFVDSPNVVIIHGDSGFRLLQVLEKDLKEPVLFWLDAHGPNWIGPVRQELAAILNSGIKGVTLIDDMDYMPDAPNLPTEYGIARIIHVG